MLRLLRSSFFPYAVAVLSVAVAAGARLALAPAIGDLFPFATLFLAVLATAGAGGFGPAAAATLLGAAVSARALLPAGDGPAGLGAEQWAGLALYIVVGLGIAALGGAMRAARDQAEAVAESAARQREELRTTLASIGDGVIVSDAAGRVVSLNPVAERLTGWTVGEAVGQPLDQVFVIVDERTRRPAACPAARALREGTVVGLANHTVLIARGGAERPIDDSAAPVRDREGGVTGAVLVFRDVSERRATELEWQEQAGTLAGILAASVDHIYVVGRDGRYRAVSDGGARVLGTEPARMVGRHWQDLGLPPETMERFDSQRERALRSGEPAREGTVYRTAGGEERHFEYLIAPVPGGDAVVVVSRDVTEEKLAEAARREAEARLAAVIDHSPAVVFLKDRQGRYLMANRQFEELARASGIEGPYLGRTDADLLPPAVAERFRRDDREVFETKRARTFEETEELGGRLRTGLTTKFPLLDAAGEVHAVGGIHLDITDRVRAEEAVRQSEGRFRGLMEQAPFSVQVFTPDGRTVGVNRAWEELWGLTLGQLGDYNLLTDPQLEAKGVAPYLRRAAAGEPVQIPAIQYDPNETIPDRTRHSDPRRWVAAVAYPLKDGSGRVREVVLVHEDRTARVRAEDALRASEATLRAFYDHSPVCMGMTEPTPAGDVLHVYDNPAGCRFFGVPPGATAGKLARADLGADPAVVARWLDRYRESAATGRSVRFEHEYPTPDGPRWLAATVCGVGPGPAGRPRFCYVAEDVTDRRARQEELRQGEERLRLALEAGRMGVWDWDVRTDAIRWSDNLEAVHGLAPGTFEGTFDAFQRLILPADRELVNRAIARALEDGSGFDIEFRNVWPDGTVHWMAGKGKVFSADGRPARMIGVGLDVTDRKRAEQDARFLAEASAALAGLTDDASALQAVARLAVPGFADWCAVDLLGDGALRRVAVAHADPAKVELAHDLHRRYPPDPDAPQGVWAIARTGRPELVPEVTAALLAATVPDAGLLSTLRELGLRSYIGVPLAVRGRVLGVVTFVAAESGRRYGPADLAVAEDLAGRAAVAVENARLYQALREADRRKDEFLALLAHELRNPLAPLRNGLHILRLAGDRAEAATAQRAQDMMGRQVDHLVRLVDDLLDVSRIMRGKVDLRREPVELAAVADRAVETSQPVIDAGGHRLTVEGPGGPLWVDADPVRLAQVVSNLLNNAAKYSDRGGHIRLSAMREGEQAVLRVRDTGTGIAPESLPRLFDLFYQADRHTQNGQGGLGIGLSLVKGLVEMHGGAVEAHSDGPGRGSEFVVRLPLLAAGGGQEGGDAGPREAGQGGRPAPLRVLVVDDNRDAADSLATLLRMEGQVVAVAYDGRAALAAALAGPPAIAFLDLGMPQMDGYELARAFRSNPALEGVVLVALTGWGQPDDRRRTAAAGFDHHLVKPIAAEALRSLLSGPPPD